MNQKHSKSNPNYNPSSQKSKSSLKSKDSGLPEGLSPDEGNDLLFRAMSNDLTELKTKLLHADAEKEKLAKQVRQLFKDKDETQRHLQSLAISHENKITEMHCIIAELSKKLNIQKENQIAEESENDQNSISEFSLSFQEGSVYHSEDEIAKQQHDLDGQETDVEQKIKSLMKDDLKLKMLEAEKKKSSQAAQNEMNYASQVEILKEEIYRLRVEKALLKSQLSDGISLDDVKQRVTADEPPQHDTSDDEAHFKAMYPSTSSENSSKKNTLLLQNISSERFDENCSENNLDTTIGNLSTAYHNEIICLKKSLEHLELRNAALTMSLAESRNLSNYLYLLCGQYESNAIALQQALNCSDRAIEAYDVMLALLESKLGILENIDCADDNRRAAESVAHLLLGRFNNDKFALEKSFAPWQDAVVLPPQDQRQPWTDEHDNQLRNHVSKLKGQRSLVHSTVITLKSPFLEDKFSHEVDDLILDCQTQDGSNSENFSISSNLKLSIHDTSTEKELLKMKIKLEKSEIDRVDMHSSMKQLQMELNKLQTQLTERKNAPDRVSYTEAEYNASIERELMDALSRESRLKARIQELAESIETANKISCASTKHDSNA